MGDFRIEIRATGGHGCDRAAREGEALTYQTDEGHLQYCPDCKIRQFVESIKGMLPDYALDPQTRKPLYGATLTHWPGTESEIVDDVLAGVRLRGHF